MSADTTMVVAKRNFGKETPDIRYTAVVVQNVEDLLDEEYPEQAVEKAGWDFLQKIDWPWFSTLGRAKSFAALLREESYIEYDKLVIIEITKDRVYELSKHGNRIPKQRVA